MNTERKLVLMALAGITEQFIMASGLGSHYRTAGLRIFNNSIDCFIKIEPSEYAKVLTVEDVIHVRSVISSLTNIPIIDRYMDDIMDPMIKIRNHLDRILSLYT